ncbi:MAG: hypothetical protein OEY09_02640 [Gammaproteobacteria bacterium]|nr:hypothetical protein [Gammaproteobacteria bacterium]
MKKSLIIPLLYLVSISPVLALANFEDIYGIQASDFYNVLADQIVSARFEDNSLSLQEQFKRLKNLQLKIETKTDEYPGDPLVWFLEGLNLNNLAEIRYLLILSQSGQKKATADREVSNYNIARSRAYSNAIRLDSKPPHQLSSTIYATMSYGLSNRQKIKTYTRELELGSPSENESNEWFLHWAKIDALVHEKKLDEAQLALVELKTLLDKANKADSAYAEIVEKAGAQIKTITDELQKRQASHQNSETSNVKPDDPEEDWSWKIWLIVSLGIFTFIAVVVIALLKRDH